MTGTGSENRRDRLEFGGVPGNLLIMVGLPLVTAWLYFSVRFNGGALLPRSDVDLGGFISSLRPTGQAAAFYLLWLVFQAGLQAFVPGRIGRGMPGPGGGALEYRLNGMTSLWLTFAAAAALELSGAFSLRFLYDQFGALLSVMTIFAFLFSLFLYFFGKRPEHGGRITHRPIHDFWMGTGRNPRIPAGGFFDLKFFCEARPGLILWMLFNASFALVQYEKHGVVTNAMLLVCGMQLLYILDYFWNESAILTTMDIKHENFGFMLVFGDLVWVPLTYSLQAAYLVDHPHTLPVWGVVGILAMNTLGLYVFRAVNLQKHHFRNAPETARIWGRKAEYLETRQGNKLLLSGFWGWSRHFNYVGDILMALSWSLPCLFDSLVPYFYPIYFAILLIHRERRDHRICSERYGADWEAYCQRVPWRIIPGIY